MMFEKEAHMTEHHPKVSDRQIVHNALFDRLRYITFWGTIFTSAVSFLSGIVIQITQLWQWYVYLLIIMLLVVILLYLFYLPLIKRKNKTVHL